MTRRYLHRRAVKGLLPTGIADKAYGGVPFNSESAEAFDFNRLYDFDSLHHELKALVDPSALIRSLELNKSDPQLKGNKAWLTRLLLLDQWLTNSEFYKQQ